MRYSIAILKPDCLSHGLVEKVVQIILSSKLKIVLQKQIKLTQNEIKIIYSHCVDENYFDNLVNFLTSGDSIVLLIRDRKNNAIQKLNNIVGETRPKYAKSGTIRSFGENGLRNLIHSSANEETFYRELNVLFTKNELSSFDIS